MRSCASATGIIPAPYMARAKWVALERWDALDDREFKPLIERAYALVKQKLPKKTQAALDSRPSAAGVSPAQEATKQTKKKQCNEHAMSAKR